MLLNSIRWRLQIWHGLLLVFVLTGFGLTAYQLQRANQMRRIDEELQQRVALLGGLMRRPGDGPGRPPFERFAPPNRRPEDQFARPVGPEISAPDSRLSSRDSERSQPPEDRPRLSGPQPAFRDGLGPPQREVHLSMQELHFFEGTASNAFYYAVWARDGRPLSRSDSAPRTLPWPGVAGIRTQNVPRAPEPNHTRMRGTLRERFHYTPPGDCILAGRAIGPELAETRRFAGLLLGAGGAVLMLGLAGGWWLSTRAIRPIKAITATAAKIAGGDLSQRIPVADAENELDQLAGVLNSTFARLEAAFAQQARFTSDAAHELRTPVSVMLTQTQSMLTRERSSSEYRETLEACQRAAQRMRRLIESLLELARLDAGQDSMKRAAVDLAQIAQECIELVRPLAAERQISIHPVLSAVTCIGDADRLKQVITNLLSNAIHYNKEGGEIHICVGPDGSAAMLTVADTGTGISWENLPHIFDRFWRADQSRSHAEGRTGLGLAIAKSIVDVHGGLIDIVSEPDKGSTFTVRLPV